MPAASARPAMPSWRNMTLHTLPERSPRRPGRTQYCHAGIACQGGLKNSFTVLQICRKLVPRTRSSRTICREYDRELRVQRGTRIMELLVVLDSEVRKSACRKVIRTSESDH